MFFLFGITLFLKPIKKNKMSSLPAIAQDSTLLTNFDKTFVFRVTGDISSYNFFADVTIGDDVSLFGMSISLSYSAETNKTTITCLITKEQIAANLTIGETYFSYLKLVDSIDTPWIKFVMPLEVGYTTTVA